MEPKGAHLLARAEVSIQSPSREEMEEPEGMAGQARSSTTGAMAAEAAMEDQSRSQRRAQRTRFMRSAAPGVPAAMQEQADPPVMAETEETAAKEATEVPQY